MSEVIAWECTDKRYPYVKGIVTTNKETVAAWTEGEIAFSPLVRASSSNRDHIFEEMVAALEKIDESGDAVECRQIARAILAKVREAGQ